MQKAVIFDIDGTLADNSARQGILEKDKRAWNKFFEGMGDDTPNKELVSLYKLIAESKQYTMIIATGRPDQYKKLTEQWLIWNDIEYQHLYMRTTGDYRPDAIVKEEMLLEIQKKYTVAFVVDDRNSVVDMWRKHGILCLQCADTN